MIKHTSKLKILKIDKKTWVLIADFEFTHNGKKHTIHKGFKTDLASIPCPVSLVLKPDGNYKESAVIHDWLLKRMYAGDTSITRTSASSVFLESLIYQKIPIYHIIPLYSGVRVYDLYKYIEKEVL